MAIPLQQANAVSAFRCLGDQCEDTCCKGWGMQLSQQTVDMYKEKAPELLDAVTSGEAEHIMKRDPETDYCIKFDHGWCGIHKDYGDSMLGDACHFFPRVTRKLGDAHLMSGSLSCPEIVRLGLVEKRGFVPVDAETDRLPHSLKDYRPAELQDEKAMEVHRFFLEAVLDEAHTPERAVAMVRSVAASLESVVVASWAMAVRCYWNNAASRLPIAEEKPEDPFNLLNALQGLIGASRKTARPRLEATLNDMAAALDTTLNWEALSIQTSTNSLNAYLQMRERWQNEWAEHFDSVLRYWLQAQLSIACFPFAGFGETLSDRASILGVRFATVKLALMAACQQKGGVIDEEQTVRVIQSLARFMDHLADPTLSMQIYHETGWTREARLRSLVGDY